MKSTFHYWGPNGEIGIPGDCTRGFGTQYEGAWHIYKIIWTPFEVIFYIDSNEIWRRTRYYNGSDAAANDVRANEIVPNVLYHDRAWFPNDHMATVFQMHVQKYVPINDLPVSMIVDYVRVKQFFLAPEITCPSEICSSATATFDVDSRASNITWQLSPASLFSTSSGSGNTTTINASGQSGVGTITFSFQMPSGETFTKSKNFSIGIKASFTGPTTILAGGSATYTGVASCGYSPYQYRWWLREDGTGEGAYLVATGSPLVLTSVPRTLQMLSQETSVSAPIIMQPTQRTYYDLYLVAIDDHGNTYTTAEKQITAYGNVDLVSYSPYAVITNSTSLNILPNPTDGQTTIELSSNETQGQSDLSEWNLEVYDQAQQLKVKKTKIRGKSTTINTSGWKEGVYILHANYKGQIVTEKLVVKRP